MRACFVITSAGGYFLRMIDDIDLKILSILQGNARTSNAEIARRVGLAPSAIFERIRKLEEGGVIRGYSLKLDARALGLGLTAFVFVRGDEPVGQLQAGDQLAAIPEVEEVHHVAGEDCYLVKLRAAGPEELGELLRQTVGAVEAVKSTRTTIVLKSLKEDAPLPLRPIIDDRGERK
jgi:Lrp/AsnC family leucine-responsive transcriptional regulator